MVGTITLCCFGWSWLTYLFRRTYFRPVNEEGAANHYSIAVQCGELLANHLFWPLVVITLLNAIGWIAWFRLHRWPRR